MFVRNATGEMRDVLLYDASGAVAHFAGCQQLVFAITAGFPVISGPSEPGDRQ